jgi:hypothetical protein
MLKNFEELKKQLTDLAGVINLYKNESVQLKIVELVFQRTADDYVEPKREIVSPALRRSRNPTKKANETDKPESAPRSSNRSGKLGSIGALNRLITEGFFKSNRTIGEIVEHCRSKLATTIKMSDLSGPLARFVRDKKLDREKNSDGQYVYFQK